MFIEHNLFVTFSNYKIDCIVVACVVLIKRFIKQYFRFQNTDVKLKIVPDKHSSQFLMIVIYLVIKHYSFR